MDIKKIELLEKIVKKLKEKNAPELKKFPVLATVDFEAVKAGTKTLKSYITDERLAEMAKELKITTEGKSRDVLMDEVIAIIKTKIESKMGAFFGKLAFWKK